MSKRSLTRAAQIPLAFPITRAVAPEDGPVRPPDDRKWRQPRSLDRGPGGIHPDDELAVRWVDGWKRVVRWHLEHDKEGKALGVLCVLEDGGSILVADPKGLMAVAPEKA